jgi:hypothetical protein
MQALVNRLARVGMMSMKVWPSRAARRRPTAAVMARRFG